MTPEREHEIHLQTEEAACRNLKAEIAQPTEDYWDQNSVMCGNCSVEILTRKGDILGNNGLSNPDAGSEDEHLCGRCAGYQMYKYQDELEVSRKITAEVEKLLNGWSAGFESIHKLQTLVLCINREKSRT